MGGTIEAGVGRCKSDHLVRVMWLLLHHPSFAPSLCAVAPTFIQDLAPTNVTFPARPRPNITWYKDGAELMEGGWVSITSKEVGEHVLESTLTVSSPFLEGIGSYTCMAENVVDTANSTAEVVIFCESLLDSN